MLWRLLVSLCLLAGFSLSAFGQAPAGGPKKKVVFVAGRPSHGYGAHEHNAGCQLLAKELQAAVPGITCEVHLNGWPADPKFAEGADCLVMYCDGGARHMVNEHLEQVDAWAKKGMGIVCLHYGVEVPKGKSGEKFLDWIGGYFETDWSVNPHWDGKFEKFPDHPISRGVQPFEINDEWYYHMRFREGMRGVTPILTALPPKETLSRPDGTHSGNPAVRQAVLERKEPQHVAWAAEREGGGRGFGFSGGHDHWNWGEPNFRKVVLNAIVWCAQGDIPAQGIESPAVSMRALEANMDPKNKPAAFDREKIRERLKLPSDDLTRAGAGTEVIGGQARRGDAGTGASANRRVLAGQVPPGRRDLQRSRLDLARNRVVQQALGLNEQQRAAIDKLNFMAIGGRDPKHDAEQAVANLDVAPGLAVTLFSSEPAISNITNIDVDAKGRVWACEVENYRWEKRRLAERPRAEGDRILVLEDVDGDGRCDQQTVFYQGRDIDSAHGVCVLGNRVIVSALDKVQVFFDEDGDLKADEKDGSTRREVLFSGIVGVQNDHGIHAFMFGPDGKLYFNMGNAGQQLKDKDGRMVVDKAGNEVVTRRKPYQDGLVLRCDLDGSGVETLGWNFRNNWEVTVDSFGTLWQSDNDDDGNRGVRINYVMEFGNYGYKDEMTGAAWKAPRENLEATIPEQHWHLNDPGVVPTMLLTGAGSPTGICVYEGTLLPEVFRNQVLHCDAGPNIVRAYVTKQDGAGYKAEIVNLLNGAERDNWFRPSDVCVAPDGSLFVADWYDPGVGGHNQQDTERGRIFRIAPPRTKYAVPACDVSTVSGAIAALGSPALSVRYLGFMALVKQGNASIEPIYKAFQASSDARQRSRLMYCGAAVARAAGRPELVQQMVAKELKNDDVNLRVVAMRIARLYGLELGQYAAAASDAAAEVRRELAISLRHSKSPAAAGLWAELAQQYDGRDRWYLEALGIAADGQWDAFLGAYLAKASEPWKTPAGRDILWRSRAKKTPELLVKIIKDPETKEAEQARYFRALDFLGGPEKEAALKSLLE